MDHLFLLCFFNLVFPSSVKGISSSLSSVLQKPDFEAIYQFGDSISDTGNILHEDPRHVCCRRPYGQTFFRHPTGRCSDGRLMIDFIAQALDLPFVEPYLNKKGNFKHGANFAVAGATALNVSTLAAKNIHVRGTKSSLLVQLDWFKSHLNALHSTPSGRKKRMEKSLFVVGEIGGNDYNNAAYQRKTMEDIHTLVPEVIQTIKNVVNELIDLGAKQFIVPGNFPVGCMTCYLVEFNTDDSAMYDDFNCLRSWNKFAMLHNDQLQNAIEDLQKEHPDVSIFYGDYYNSLTSILEHASSLGFEEDILHKACCGSGGGDYNYNLDRRKECGFDLVPVCSDPSKRLSWDGVHLTEHAYQLMANWMLKRIFPTQVAPSCSNKSVM